MSAAIACIPCYSYDAGLINVCLLPFEHVLFSLTWEICPFMSAFLSHYSQLENQKNCSMLFVVTVGYNIVSFCFLIKISVKLYSVFICGTFCISFSVVCYLY